MSQSRVLFIVGGLGLGNSTRCLAVIQELTVQGIEVEVATGANGRRFFLNNQNIKTLHLLIQTGYLGARQSLGFVSILLSGLCFPVIGLCNSFRLLRIIRQSKPSVVVLDSNYNLVPFFYGRHRLLSLNNSVKIVKQSHKLAISNPRWAVSHGSQFIVELCDFIFQRIVPSQVISPWPESCKESGSEGNKPGLRNHFLSVEPIVRKEYLSQSFPQGFKEQPRSALKQSLGILVIYSGSGVGPRFHEELVRAGHSVTVIGAGELARNSAVGHAIFIDQTFDSSQWLKSSDLVICSGGFSSISEALACHKPLIIVPIPGHAEQMINALWVESLGVGLKSSPERVLESVEEMRGRLSDIEDAYIRLDFQFQGATQSADIISSHVLNSSLV